MLIFIVLFYLLVAILPVLFQCAFALRKNTLRRSIYPLFILKSLSCLYLYKIIYIFAT